MRSGFSVTELLIVLVFVSIFLIIGFNALTKYQTRLELQEALRLVATEFKSARSDTIRYSLSHEVAWTKDELTIRSGESERKIDISATDRVFIETKDESTKFAAPYATLGSSINGEIITLTSTRDQTLKASVLLYGMTGKVFTHFEKISKESPNE